MRKIFCILSCLLVAGCTSFDRNPYDGALRELRVTAVYPEGYAGYLREGVAVKLSDRNTGNVYTALTDAQGHAGFRVAAGHYRLSVLDLPDDSAVFNGTIEQVDLVGGDKDVDVALKFSKPGTILIKEIYSGGCMQDPPATGTYADDKYIVLHNNSFETYYLDGLCLAMVAPYNSNANNPWTSTDPSGNIVFRDYAAIPDCIWMFPGSGTDFPLEPGEDAVVAYYGVDHTQTYSQSVNLNRKGYFVLYDMVHYPGNKLHPTPVPGDQIDQAHYMKVLKKTGTNSAVVYVMLVHLRGLRQCVELAVVDTGRHDVVARALWGGLYHHRGLDLGEAVCVEVLAGCLCYFVAHHEVLLERLAAQVEVAVLEA